MKESWIKGWNGDKYLQCEKCGCCPELKHLPPVGKDEAWKCPFPSCGGEIKCKLIIEE